MPRVAAAGPEPPTPAHGKELIWGRGHCLGSTSPKCSEVLDCPPSTPASLAACHTAPQDLCYASSKLADMPSAFFLDIGNLSVEKLQASESRGPCSRLTGLLGAPTPHLGTRPSPRHCLGAPVQGPWHLAASCHQVPLRFALAPLHRNVALLE